MSVAPSSPLLPLSPKTPEPRRKPSEVSEEEMMEALRAHGYDLAAASNQLGITRASLNNLMKKARGCARRRT